VEDAMDIALNVLNPSNTVCLVPDKSAVDDIRKFDEFIELRLDIRRTCCFY
jgi:hypothetical protein